MICSLFLRPRASPDDEADERRCQSKSAISEKNIELKRLAARVYSFCLIQSEATDDFGGGQRACCEVLVWGHLADEYNENLQAKVSLLLPSCEL